MIVLYMVYLGLNLYIYIYDVIAARFDKEDVCMMALLPLAIQYKKQIVFLSQL